MGIGFGRLPPGAEGRGGEGGQVPPLNFQFFLLISDNDNALN